MSALKRVRITWTDGTPDVDLVMDSVDVQGFLAPLKRGYVFMGNSGGGRLDRMVDGREQLVGRITVTDAPQPISIEGN